MSSFNSTVNSSLISLFNLFISCLTVLASSVTKVATGFSSAGNKLFNKIPMIAAKLIPEIVNDKSPLTIDTAAPPNPNTNIELATITFFASSKLT